MKPGQFVQVRFNNGTFFDGTILDWSDGKSRLSLEDGSEIIIQKTLQDVLLVKILIAPEKKKEQTYHLQDKFNQLKALPKEPEQLAELATLKDQLNKLEREEFKQKMTSFNKEEKKSSNYGILGNIKIARAPQHSAEEVTRTHSPIDQELQKLFR